MSREWRFNQNSISFLPATMLPVWYLSDLKASLLQLWVQFFWIMEKENYIHLWKPVISFNPCFNGFFSSIGTPKMINISSRCFNPCFNGFFSSIKTSRSKSNVYQVSILVLMDSSLQCNWNAIHLQAQLVSILVLMDSSLQYPLRL